MKYYKNTELAQLYHVSEKSVRNWISAAQEGKLDLQLYSKEGKQLIANTSKNTELIRDLVQKGKKYRNSRGFKTISPKSQFYKVYNSKEIFDIISSLDVNREIPHQYSYFNGGASEWDLYVQKLAQEKTPNLLTDTIELLNLNTPYLDLLLEEHTRVNVIDIGLGNCFPVRNLLQHLKDSGKLNRYIGLDISRDMLEIAERNIKSWFGDTIEFEGYVRDINYERFDDLLAPDSFSQTASVINVVLFLGSTIASFRTPHPSLYTIRESIGKNDLFVFSMKLDSANSRRYFDFDSGDSSNLILSQQDAFILELLNIDSSLYEVEQFFDEKRMARRIQVRLKVALSIEFQLEGKSRVINLNKGEAILLWQHKHLSNLGTIEQFDEDGFDLLQAMRSKDQECLLTISKIKTDNL